MPINPTPCRTAVSQTQALSHRAPAITLLRLLWAAATTVPACLHTTTIQPCQGPVPVVTPAPALRGPLSSACEYPAWCSRLWRCQRWGRAAALLLQLLLPLPYSYTLHTRTALHTHLLSLLLVHSLNQHTLVLEHVTLHLRRENQCGRNTDGGNDCGETSMWETSVGESLNETATVFV